MASETSYYPGYNAWAGSNPRADAMLRTPAISSPGAIRGAISSAQGSFAGMNARLGSSYLGRSLQIGVGESLGHTYSGSMFGVKGVQSQGFLGLRAGGPAGTQPSTIFPGREVQGKGGPFKGRGLAGRFKGGGGGVGRAFGGAMGIGFTALYAYQGYKENGIAGAAQGIGESVLWSAGMRAAGGLISNPYLIPVAATIGVTAGATYALGEAGRKHHKKLREVEMGGGEIMSAIGSHGAATMRQRSVMALQNTHINGRMAMGNEALFMHTSLR